jgi:hypothetical protein
VLLLAGDIAQQAAGNGPVYCLVQRRRLVPGEAPQLAQGLAQLGVDVAPLAHTRVGEEVGAAETAHAALGLQLVQLGVIGAPDIEQHQEVGLGVGKAAVHLVRGLLLV